MRCTRGGSRGKRPVDVSGRTPRFYTSPPPVEGYPYILINANKPDLSYLRRNSNAIRGVIIDSGIEIFRDERVKDYPRGHEHRMLRLYSRVKAMLPNAEVLVTVPDYCDDYHPRSLWLSDEVTNIERTVANVERLTGQHPEVNWLIPVQGWNSQPRSIIRCIDQYRELGILDRYDYFAIGNLCVEPSVRITCETIKIARELLPRKRIHVFGLKLKALKHVATLIDSFDSAAWTRQVSRRLRANWSCKNIDERRRFFLAWLNRANEILAQSTLYEWLTG